MSVKPIVFALFVAFASQAATAEVSVKTGKRPASRPAAAKVASTLPADDDDSIGRVVFETLLGELALRRGDAELAVSAWADLARRTQDPKALSRAAEVAAFARKYDLALEITRLWLQVEPDSAKARQTHSSLLILAGRLEELAPQISAFLAQEPQHIAANLIQLNRMLARHGNKKEVQALVDRVAAPYAGLPEARFAMAQAALAAENDSRAASEIDAALQLRPEWEAAALLRAQIASRRSNGAAIDSLQNFLGRAPAASDARLALARLLIVEKRYADARTHFDHLLGEQPDNPEVVYPAAMLALQQGDAGAGKRLLDRLLDLEFANKSAVRYFLGQLDEEAKRPDEAIEHYRQVGIGEHYLNARARAAQLLRESGRIDEARQLFQETKASTPAERTQLILAESQLLRENGRQAEALALLDKTLQSDGDNIDLLYEAALLAERQGKPEVLESRIKRLLKIKPDHAHALNALGYSLAERNIRLREAETLIAKALALAPEDPFIMDSLGWVQFRQGRHAEALKTLEKAYALRADPEIAAHLGEVLWVMQRRDEASSVLLKAAEKNPDNEVLAATVRRLLP